MKLPKKKLLVALSVGIGVVVLIAIASGLYYLGTHKEAKTTPTATKSASKQTPAQTQPEQPQSFPYTLVAYKGTVFGAKVPQGWSITDNESGIDVMDPADNSTGAVGAVAVGWYGYQTP